MKVSQFFSDESKWTKKIAFRDVNGGSMSHDCYLLGEPSRRDIKSCCIIGSVFYCYPENIDERARIFAKLNYLIGDIGKWNDSITFKQLMEIVELLDI